MYFYLYKHYLYPDPAKSLNETGYINKLYLSKAAEISADRVGLLACGNLKFSLQSLFKNITGLPDQFINFDYDFFLNQLDDLKEFKNNFSSLYSTHPSILNRVQALIWFADSYEYQKQINNNNDNKKFKLKEVDLKIDKSLRDVLGNEFNVQNKEIFDSLKLWVTISFFLMDKNFSKKEQKIFEDNFGKEKLKDIKFFLNSASLNSVENKIKESLVQAFELSKSDKEKLIFELENIAGLVNAEERDLIEQLSRISSKLGLKSSVTIRKDK